MDTKVLERPYGEGFEQPGLRVEAPSQRSPRSPRRRAVALLASGAALMIAAGALVTTSISGGGRHNPGPAVPAAAAVAAEGEWPDVGVAENVYQPGHTSGWHTHPGVHSAVVLSGTLTVYDASCTRHEFGPGDTYLGGRDPHVARNDTAEPVQLAVTYVFARVSPLDHATVVAPPAGCDVR